MKIGVMSDTHLYKPDRNLDLIVKEILADAQMVLHAGDIVGHEVLDWLEENGVVCVCGNMDESGISRMLPGRRIFAVEGIQIGLVHGWGPKHDLESRIVASFAPDTPDLIVYGHSHVPFWGMIDGVRMFNPGSAANGAHGGRGSVGMIEIDDSGIQTRFMAV